MTERENVNLVLGTIIRYFSRVINISYIALSYYSTVNKRALSGLHHSNLYGKSIYSVRVHTCQCWTNQNIDSRILLYWKTRQHSKAVCLKCYIFSYYSEVSGIQYPTANYRLKYANHTGTLSLSHTGTHHGIYTADMLICYDDQFNRCSYVISVIIILQLTHCIGSSQAGTKQGPNRDQAGTKQGPSRDQAGTEQGPSMSNEVKQGQSREKTRDLLKWVKWSTARSIKLLKNIQLEVSAT